ncbi:hypothetical protein PUN28_006263 [Cardiocondyla obscurior]|uniref:Uncharacterized protein n=1 Tax=Cardiocondyla obscurior TaxID=286306 RepID=A0AAW2G8E0_9HYME
MFSAHFMFLNNSDRTLATRRRSSRTLRALRLLHNLDFPKHFFGARNDAQDDEWNDGGVRKTIARTRNNDPDTYSYAILSYPRSKMRVIAEQLESRPRARNSAIRLTVRDVRSSRTLSFSRRKSVRRRCRSVERNVEYVCLRLFMLPATSRRLLLK